MNIKEQEISNPLKSREKKQKGVQSGANVVTIFPKKKSAKKVEKAKCAIATGRAVV